LDAGITADHSLFQDDSNPHASILRQHVDMLQEIHGFASQVYQTNVQMSEIMAEMVRELEEGEA